MEFAVIGVTYREVSTEMREKVAFTDMLILKSYEELLDIGIRQAVIISTCNRSEWYFLYEDKEQINAAKALFGDMTYQGVASLLFTKEAKNALGYLYEVCLGYHSLALGEDQILGQMQKAYQFALCANATSKEMNKLFQSCFACVKDIKTAYKISERPTSVVSLAMQQLKDRLSFDNRTILIVGSGNTAELVLQYVKEEAYQEIYLCNRTLSHIEHQAERHIHILPFAQRYEILPMCDIIFSATSSPHVIFEEEKVAVTKQPQMFIDLAVPRDIDVALLTRRDCTLLNMDTLQQTIDEHKNQRKNLLQQAAPLIQRNVEEFYAWFVNHSMEQAIQTLQERSAEMAEHTYEILMQKLQLDHHEQCILKKVLHSSFLRMIKEPMLTLKELQEEDQSTYLKMVETLFKGV